jgi:hypothetical protein
MAGSSSSGKECALLQVQRTGDAGSPRVIRSTTFFSACRDEQVRRRLHISGFTAQTAVVPVCGNAAASAIRLIFKRERGQGGAIFGPIPVPAGSAGT